MNESSPDPLAAQRTAVLDTLKTVREAVKELGPNVQTDTAIGTLDNLEKDVRSAHDAKRIQELFDLVDRWEHWVKAQKEWKP